MNEISVIGYPSKLGGADTELDHQIRAWQSMGIRVHLIHTGDLDDNLKAMKMEERGCVVHKPRDWSKCRGMPVISYCNGEFLESLPEIRKFAKSVWWVNCMSWLFPKEQEAHKEGLIDLFIYQTERVRNLVTKKLVEINGEFRSALVNPYFHSEDFPFRANRPTDRFRFCRISREDLGKFHPAQLWIYESMVAPVLKEGIMLGVNDSIREKIGREPNWISAYPAGGRSAREVYEVSDCFIQMADPSMTENLPRVAFEAMASGCVLCVDDRGGWREQIVHGQTGFLCRDQREFVYYASRLAFERAERAQMAERAREHLESKWGLEAAKESWTTLFNDAP